ncbi:MAG: hypothetical protein ACXVXZ_13955 [Mycobacteriaceae bacterium]
MTNFELNWQDAGMIDRELFFADGNAGRYTVRLWKRTPDREHDWLLEWTPTRADVLVQERVLHGLQAAMDTAGAWERG